MEVFYLVVMILGCFLGAGFVSGREIASYFSRFGQYSMLAIFVASVLFFLILYMFLRLSNYVSNFNSFVSYYFGRFKSLIVFLFSLCLLILVASMIAGTIAISNTLNISSFVILLITVILSYLVVIGNEKLLAKVNIVLIPIILVFIIYVCGINVDIKVDSSNGFFAIVSSINYVLINMVTLGIFVLEIGHKYTNKQKLLASAITTIIVFLYMVIINNSVINNELIDYAMPILELSKNKGIWQMYFSAIVIWCGLFTTIISCVYVLSNFVSKIIKNYKISVMLVLLLSMVVSGLGFEYIVGYVYSIIGIIGFIFIVFIGKKEKETLIARISSKKF